MKYSRCFLFFSFFCVPIAFANLPINQWTTDNGMRVLFVETHEIPMVDVQFTFDAGSSRDAKHPGIAKLTNSLLVDGTDELNADDVASGFEKLGANYEYDVDRDSASFHVRMLSKKNILEPALSLMSEVITHPSFPPAAFKRAVKNLITDLKAQEESPAYLADEKFYQLLYQNTPYAHPIFGTEKSLASIRQRDVIAFYHQFYVSENGVMSIVGDLSLDQAKSIANQLSKGFAKGKKASPIALPEHAKQAQTAYIDFPSSQTFITLGEMGVSRADPNFFALYVGNYILGANPLVSKLFVTVREKEGLTYSIDSYFLPLRYRGPFIINLQTRKEQTEKAIAITQKTLADFIQQGPTDAELSLAKQNIIDGFPLRISSNSNILQYLSIIGFYNLPIDYLDTFRNKIAAVTREQITKAFQQQLTAPTPITVLVGHDKP